MSDNCNKENKSVSKKHKIVKIRKISYLAGSCLFILALAILFVMSFDISRRPSFSESEKRELAEFPKFSFSSLADGEYFDGITLWFSDTFPFRDTFVKSSSSVKKLMGIGQKVINFSENGGDEIPHAEEMSGEIAQVEPQSAQTAENDLMKPALPAQPHGGSDGSDGALGQSLGSIYIYAGAAYEYYNFVRSTADGYAAAINSAASSLEGSGINIYNMIIPTSMDITLDDKIRAKLNSSDQSDAVNYMYSQMSGQIKTVPIYDLLRAHRDEYIYFGTDHHWTALGAYYAYAQYMTVKGEDYARLDRFTQYAFEGFLGSFYTGSDRNYALEKSPDTVYAYVPNDSVSFKMKQQGADDYMDWALVCDASDYSPSYKYLCFIGGDNPVSVIENKTLQSSKTCVFVKESFGNAFAPFLACNYKYVYIIDYRYFDGDITDFAKEKNADDLLIQNNISMTRNEELVETLKEKL